MTMPRAINPMMRSMQFNPGVYHTRDGKTFTKAFNLLKNTHLEKIETHDITQAEALANFFMELRERGFYHPKTIFAIIEAGCAPTVAAVMPRLHENQKLNQAQLQKATLPTIILEERGIYATVSGDLKYAFNWGRASDGETYCMDL